MALRPRADDDRLVEQVAAVCARAQERGAHDCLIKDCLTTHLLFQSLRGALGRARPVLRGDESLGGISTEVALDEVRVTHRVWGPRPGCRCSRVRMAG